MKLIKLLFLFSIIVIAWFFLVLNSGNGLDTDKAFIIKQGQGVNEISVNLADNNLIKNKFVFETWLWLKKSESEVKAGIYTVPADISIREISNLILLVPTNQQNSLTIIEGWSRNLTQLKNVLEKNNFSYQGFLDLTKNKSDWQEEFTFLKDAPASASLEGYLYPDTYFVDTNTTVEDLIKKVLNNFDRKLTKDLTTEIARQNKTIFEVVTLASIIEREVPQGEDKKKIADVFLKRLEAGIGLQSDATVNFVTGKGLAQPTLVDLQVDSPYNTYKYRGLPPGPISNPSISSIEAVIYPIENDYYYFLTTKEGEVIYSKTYEEHLRNKAKYLD
ncbi:endolytic transglycosylase MltG [Candidatus Nomurabacteria bacterium]|nr:endolytic transglycosylase MltG [Candidatus Nomurabacteria bacterium]